MELNKQDIDDEFREVRLLIEELSNNLKWQKEEHEKCVASMEGLETEVDNLIGDFTKAKKILKWKPKNSLNQLIHELLPYEQSQRTN